MATALHVTDLAGHVVLVDDGLLQEHVEAPFVLRQRVTRHSVGGGLHRQAWVHTTWGVWLTVHHYLQNR